MACAARAVVVAVVAVVEREETVAMGEPEKGEPEKGKPKKEEPEELMGLLEEYEEYGMSDHEDTDESESDEE